MIKNRMPRQNALVFVCGLIEYIGRMTLNTRTVVIDYIKSDLQFIYDCSDVMHCEIPEEVATEYIVKHRILKGTFDNVGSCNYRVPGCFEIGRVLAQLIDSVCDKEGLSPIDALLKVYHCPVIDAISDFNSAAFFSQPGEIYYCYERGWFPPIDSEEDE